MSLNRKQFIALATALVAGGAMAQGYPAKPITLVVPAAAGGTTSAGGTGLSRACLSRRARLTCLRCGTRLAWLGTLSPPGNTRPY